MINYFKMNSTKLKKKAFFHSFFRGRTHTSEKFSDIVRHIYDLDDEGSYTAFEI